MSKKFSDTCSSVSGDVSVINGMGRNNSSDISRYNLREENGENVLRTCYKIKKNSLLPTRRKYRFGRFKKTIITNSGKLEYSNDHQISNVLQQVLKELDDIVRNTKGHDELTAAFTDELDHLGCTVSSRIRELHLKIEQL